MVVSKDLSFNSTSTKLLALKLIPILYLLAANAVNHEDGTFAEYVTAKGDLQFKIPQSLSFTQAATMGVGLTTVGQYFYQPLGVSLPTAPATTPFPVFINGGSTATGTLAIQMAKL